jgi:hypothetical protein
MSGEPKLVKECTNCFNTREIWNGKEMIPCPDCTDSSFKSQDYQTIKKKILDENLKDEGNIELEKID